MQAACEACCAALRAGPQANGHAADELLSRLDKEGRGVLGVWEVLAALNSCRTKLGLPSIDDDAHYLKAMSKDVAGSNKLGRGALSDLFLDLVYELPVTPGSASGLIRPPTPPPKPPPSPSEPFQITLRTLGGSTLLISVSGLATVEDLRLAATRPPIGIGGMQELLFAAEGRLLGDGPTLREQGVVGDSFVDVLRVTPAPTRVRLECNGKGCGPSIRGSCGTFTLSTELKNGRTIYVRDAELSKWNTAMAYHGKGRRFLVCEEHPNWGRRWALTDDQDWEGYDDRSYAFILENSPHPGYLEGRRWCVYKDRILRGQPREWVEQESLRLFVEED